MELTRRGLITGLASFLAAPAIVRAGSLMPVKALPVEWLMSGEFGPLLQYRQEFIAAFEENYAVLQAIREDVLVITGISEREFFRTASDISQA